MEKKQHPRAKKIWAGIFYAFTGLGVFFVALISFSAIWAFTNWGDLDIDEIIFQLKTPLEGTGNGMVGSYILKGFVPTLAVLAIYIVVMILMKQSKRRLAIAIVFLGIAIGTFFLIQPPIWRRLDVKNWLKGQIDQSDFVKDNYVDPDGVKLTFPEKKRNLIYIYLESMETTFADIPSGGDFSKNIIPELTEIAKENEDFSGTDEKLNGGIVFPGTGFTTGGIFARSVGLPLKLDIFAESMDEQTSFFPNVTALGDILEEEGYKQVFLLGSDSSFGGRRLYFGEHGDFEIRDYVYAQENEWIDPDYMVWWGFEDEKLFSFAEDTLMELADGDEPFNLTILTVDTHFEDGYVCDLCEDEFGDDQYANVMACSSRQVASFLSWLQEQDFYENTTVILTGDHTTMDTDFCDNVSEDYQRRTYTAYINSAAAPVDPERKRDFSTFDDFPTTLAAMGVSIDGDRLGLGVNLFSDQDTLLEEYGYSYLRSELSRRSDFLAKLQDVDHQTAAIGGSGLINPGQVDPTDHPWSSLSYNEVGDKTDFKAYFKSVSENPDYSVFLAVKDEACEGLTTDMLSSLHLLGLRANLLGREGTSYLAAVGNGKAYERSSYEDLEYEGVLPSGVKYSLLSVGSGEEPDDTAGKNPASRKDSASSSKGTDATANQSSATSSKESKSTAGKNPADSRDSASQLDQDSQNPDSLASIQIGGVEYSFNHRGINYVIYDNTAQAVIDAGYFDTHLAK